MGLNHVKSHADHPSCSSVTWSQLQGLSPVSTGLARRNADAYGCCMCTMVMTIKDMVPTGVLLGVVKRETIKQRPPARMRARSLGQTASTAASQPQGLLLG